ncbi:unnamed protein product [Callosobruchus maculatus]|uniref:Uncharacterized protein n=1 Tax=Callosobruchus maculatus TaxID=64391 RepID=A0A653BM14_CALMS|nr:unnamed protein product [Callosobruchus maculatus]
MARWRATSNLLQFHNAAYAHAPFNKYEYAIACD